jgi:hypothetical protein
MPSPEINLEQARPKRWLTDRYRLRKSDLATLWLHLESSCGDLDLILKTPGVSYEKLRADADEIAIEGAIIVVASVESLLAVKRRAGRSKDVQQVAELEQIQKLRGRESEDQ